jgi:hypothetical protein
MAISPKHGWESFLDTGSFYQLVTARAEQAILQLTGESRGQLDKDNQAHWDMANGVMRLWRDLAGDDIRAEDADRLELLLADMPGIASLALVERILSISRAAFGKEATPTWAACCFVR